MQRLSFIVLAISLLGCPSKTTTPDVETTETCSSAGDRCKLGGGQLGICAHGPGGLFCASQH